MRDDRRREETWAHVAAEEELESVPGEMHRESVCVCIYKYPVDKIVGAYRRTQSSVNSIATIYTRYVSQK